MNDAKPPLLVQRGWFWLGVAALAGLVVVHQLWFQGSTPRPEAGFRTERYQLPQEAVTDLTIKPVHAVTEEIADDELVLGVTIGNEARAYPLNMMYAAPHTKVLNDHLAGRALAVTWCEKCMTGAVFERQVDGAQLTFAVFGSLWRDTIVLYDLETMTQWSQWDGEAKLGTHAGRKLVAVPCVIVDWKTWRTGHPKGTVAVLAESRTAFDAAAFAQAADYVLIAGEGKQAKTWELDEIRRRQVINDVLVGEPVLLVSLESSGTARLFARSLEGATLTFTFRDGQLRDAGTGTTWDPLTGRAVAGALQGRQLPHRNGRLVKRAALKRLMP